jgi:hypothetical protein
MTDKPDLNPDEKPWFRLADDEDIANMSTAFTLPGRLAKQLADRQKRIEQQRAQDPTFGTKENIPEHIEEVNK